MLQPFYYLLSIINSYGLTKYDNRAVEKTEEKKEVNTVNIADIIKALKALGYTVKTQTEKELSFYKGTDTATLKDGDIIKLKDNATYYNGKAIPSWVKTKTLYYRGSNKNGVIFSTLKTGAITGVVVPSMII